MPYGSHFGTYAMNTFQEKISQNNYRLTMFPVREEEVTTLQLPLGFDKTKVAGIVCMEMFDPEYTKMLSALHLPLLFIDTTYDMDFTRIDADFLLMENRLSVFNLTDALIKKAFKDLHLLATIAIVVPFSNDIRDLWMHFRRIRSFHVPHNFVETMSFQMPLFLMKQYAEPSSYRKYSYVQMILQPLILFVHCVDTA